MSSSDPRIAAQLRSLDQSACVRDLLNLNSATREILCDTCLSNATDGPAFNAILRHRVNIGESVSYEFCSVCARRLSFAQPAYRCSVCFDVVIGFLTTRSYAELLECLGSQSTVIAVSQESAPFTRYYSSHP